MKKTLLSLAMTATLGLASVSASAAFLDFQVNEGVVPGNGGMGTVFTADKMTGRYSELLGLTSATTFSASAVGIFTGYANNEGTGSPGGTLLTGDSPSTFTQQYRLYAKFTATGTATSPTTFIGTGGTLELYLDPDANTAFSIPGGAGFNDFTSLATATGGAGDDQLIGSSSVSYGTGDLFGPPGAFNIFFEQLVLTPFGQTYWFDLNTLDLVVQTNGDIDTVNTVIDPVTGLPRYRITGDFSAVFNDVPEPGTLALMGIAIAGLGFVQRRKQVV